MPIAPPTQATAPLAVAVVLLLLGGCALPVEAIDDAPSGDLAWSVGLWSGYREAGSDGSREPMRLRVTPCENGPALFRVLEVGTGDAPYRGFAFVSPRATGGWSWRYANGPDKVPAHYVCDAPGAVSVWTPRREQRGPVDVRRRMEESLHADGTWTRTMTTSHDDGATWQVLFTDHLRRVKE